jgi:hypothetical protein
MNPKETLKKIKTLLGVQVALETMKLDNGVEVEAEVFETGNSIFIVQGEEKVALPEGEYKLEDGRILIASEEGVIGEIKEEATEEIPAEQDAPIEEPEMSEAPTAVSTPKKVIESVSKEIHFEKVSELEKTIEELKAQIVELSSVVEVKEEIELSVEPVSHNPESLSKKKEIKTQKRLLTTQDRVFAKLFKN